MPPKKEERNKGRTSTVKRPGRYNATLTRTLHTLEQQLTAAAAAEEVVVCAREREKILIDFINCQEELERLLELQEALLAGIDNAQDPAAAAQAALSTSVAGQSPCSSWCTSMVSRVTVGHILHVQKMSMQDWCSAGCASFVQLSALLELVNRGLQAPVAVPEGFRDGGHSHASAAGSAVGLQVSTDPSPAASAAAVAAVGPPLSSVPTAAAGPSAANVPAAAAAAAGADSACGTGAAPDLFAAAAALLYTGSDLALYKFMDQCMVPVFAAMFYAPQPYYAAAACNLCTGQVELMSQSHLMQVLERMQLSPQQVMHLRITNTEFVRLARNTSQEGETLAELTAKLSLSEVTRKLQESGGSNEQRSGSGSNPLAQDSKAEINNAAAQASRLAAAAAAAAEAERDASSRARSESVAPRSGSVDRSGGSGASLDAGAIELEGGETADEQLSRQLDRYLRHMHIHTVVTAMCVVNTLTPQQMAMMNVASYPYAPNVHAIAEACMYYKAPDTAPPQLSAAAAAAAGDAQDELEELGERPQQQQREQQSKNPWRAQVDQHMALRGAQLEKQVQEWWRSNSSFLGQMMP